MDMIPMKGAQIGSSMFPSFGKYYMEELNDLYATNIEKAKELLTEAGYPDGFSFTLTVPSNYQQHVDTAQVIAEQLKEIGVTANIQLIEWESWLSDVYSDRNYEATVVGVDASSLTAAALLSDSKALLPIISLTLMILPMTKHTKRPQQAQTMTKRPDIIRNAKRFWQRMRQMYTFRICLPL